MTDRELINLAFAASERAYAPYSGFRVGAAVECADGTVFTGCNIENSALGESVSAEIVAVCKAISENHKDFVRLAIAAESESYCMPCGSSRQFLSEFDLNIELLCAKADGGYVSYRLRELLPNPFRLREE